jgi:hypothetical protein
MKGKRKKGNEKWVRECLLINMDGASMYGKG